jgi:DNA modification methylase
MSIDAVLEGRARWCVSQGDCLATLPRLPDAAVDVVVTDPPYSAHVHKSVRSAKRMTMPDVEDSVCRTRRTVDLGFEHLSGHVRRNAARQFARVGKRWTLVFSDIESDWLWRLSLTAAGLEYIRTPVWHRIGGAPQFTGDRPATGVEAITLAHPKGRKRWNGGGKSGVYSFPIAANRFGADTRVHETQKPLELMLALVEDFTEPNDIVLDAFCGSGTTGVAAVRLGRRFIGIEQKPQHAQTAIERLMAEEQQLDLKDARRGQESLFR